jgi:hypothetical protein
LKPLEKVGPKNFMVGLNLIFKDFVLHKDNDSYGKANAASVTSEYCLSI